MSTTRRKRRGTPSNTIRTGMKLPPQLAAMVTVALIFERAGDDISGEYDQLDGVTLLQADGDEHLLERLEFAHQQGQLRPAIDTLIQAITDALGGEVVRRTSPDPTPGRQVGRA